MSAERQSPATGEAGAQKEKHDMTLRDELGIVRGIGPDGDPATFEIAEGRSFSWRCPDCGDYNGGGIVNEEFTEQSRRDDPSSPGNVPCVWCGKGPMTLVYDDEPR